MDGYENRREKQRSGVWTKNAVSFCFHTEGMAIRREDFISITNRGFLQCQPVDFFQIFRGEVLEAVDGALVSFPGDGFGGHFGEAGVVYADFGKLACKLEVFGEEFG